MSALVASQMPGDSLTRGEIEEGSQAYRPGGFHPVYIGDVFCDRYKVLNKIGYGAYSTVWLVRDLKAEAEKPSGTEPGSEHVFRALKVLRADCYDGSQDSIFEREILTHLRKGDRKLMGYAYVCHLVNEFEHKGPNGTHVCLVFELMGETLRSFGSRFEDHQLPYSVMRRVTIQLLLAVDFAHAHNVIHTDIQPNNIFVKFRDFSLIESGYLATVAIPQQDRSEEQYSPIPSAPLRRFYFNEADRKRVADFDFALGDWGVSSWADNHFRGTIQPVALRSPEVLIQAPWKASTDFWNLGAVLFELFCAVRMFDGRGVEDQYSVREHLAEIVAMFGPFHKGLLERGNQELVKELFDDEGRIKNKSKIIRPPLCSEAFMPGLEESDREEFASFLKMMMRIDPDERGSAEDIMRYPWLRALPPIGEGSDTP